MTSLPLHDVRSFYTHHFPDHRIDLDIGLESHFFISLFEGSALPAVVVAGLNEPSIREFTETYFTEDQWNTAVSRREAVVGIIVFDENLFPDDTSKRAIPR
ncbi:MAG: hypothetical protein AAF357_02195 [Verrucomicrobiota bacterium]